MKESSPAPVSVFDAMSTRRSVRGFLPDPVDRSTVERILALASRAPSGSNIQPWKVWVVSGAVRDRLTARITDAFLKDDPACVDEFQYYPREWNEPYLSRRRKLGFDLYQLAGIPKGDTAAMKIQHAKNFSFFGAPVGIFVTIERQMEQGGWMDLGGFIQSILLAARGFGLDTCPQHSFARFHRIIREELGIDDCEMVACGIALGYADRAVSVNRLVSEREPVSAFARFYGD